MSELTTDRVTRLIVDELDFPTPPGFNATTPLFKGGVEMDSFTAVELVMLIERHFAITLAAADIVPANFANAAAVGRLVDTYLRR